MWNSTLAAPLSISTNDRDTYRLKATQNKTQGQDGQTHITHNLESMVVWSRTFVTLALTSLGSYTVVVASAVTS